MLAQIYKPAKTAMQSGRRNTKRWVLEFEREEAREIDPLMGWTSSGETESQVRLYFDTKQEAIAYAQRNNIPHQVVEAKEREVRPQAYADNFDYERVEPWTH